MEQLSDTNPYKRAKFDGETLNTTDPEILRVATRIGDNLSDLP